MKLINIIASGIALVSSTSYSANGDIEALKNVVALMKAEIDALKMEAAPQGSIMAFNKDNCPRGWLAADGTKGTPDLRGVFIRGLNDFGTGQRTDSWADSQGNRALGSFQLDDNKAHSHSTSAAGEHTHSINLAGAHSHSGTTGPGNSTFYRTVASTGTDSLGNHVAGWAGGGHFVDRTDANYPLRTHTHSFTTNTAGNHTHSMSKSGSHTHSISASGGVEARPKNIGLIYCVRKSEG